MADYSKACDHPNIERRPHSRTWICLECGHDVPELGAETMTATVEVEMTREEFRAKYSDPMRADAAAMGIGTPGSFTEALGPIKIDYTRDQALRDARVANWRKLPWQVKGAWPPNDKAFFVAWMHPERRWSVLRISPGMAVPAEATHWCDDLLGLPACSD